MKKFKKIQLACSLPLMFAMSNVFGHTSIQSTITASSGKTSTSYNNIIIGHTCTDEKGKKFPLVAQSVVFPTVNPLILIDASTTASSLKITDLITSTTGLANLPQLIQSRDIFEKLSEKTDASGNVIGFNGYKGNLDSSLHGVVPFRFGSLTFNSNINGLSGNCVKTLNIKVAIADICKLEFPSGGPVEGKAQANLWIPNTTSKFANVVDGTSATARAGSPATLTIDNSSACSTGSTVYIWPSDEDIDANLIIPKVWGK